MATSGGGNCSLSKEGVGKSGRGRERDRQTESERQRYRERQRDRQSGRQREAGRQRAIVNIQHSTPVIKSQVKAEAERDMEPPGHS